MPKTAEQRDNHRVLLEKIADAYERELRRAPDTNLALGVLMMLDSYMESFQAAHSDEPPPAAVDATRRAARDVLNAADEALAARKAAMPLRPMDGPVRGGSATSAKRRETRWTGLAIAGGVNLGAGAAMLAMFIVNMARARSLQRQFDDESNRCILSRPEGNCAEIYRDGQIADRTAVSGLILGPIFLGAGITMLTVALGRRHSARKLAPVVSPHMLGFTLEQRF